MRKSTDKDRQNAPQMGSSFEQRTTHYPFDPIQAELHVYGKNSKVCLTDSRGFATPKNRNPAELVLDASEGFIPLWAKGVNLRWRFNPRLLNYFQNPIAAITEIRSLFSEALLAWGDAAPVTFSERNDAWDFEIAIRSDNCDSRGCTLASAFFPDSGRHELAIYPMLFQQPREEQVETMIHELGHIFGLRHFFANVSEIAFPSVQFGKHTPFTIMNYGEKSVLTEQDKSDLKHLYEKVWSGELQHINGTRVVTFVPFHQLGAAKLGC